MRHLLSRPAVDVFCAVLLILVGALMLRYRREIGALTGYYTGRGGWVDKPTPGWMIIPFAIALIVLGIAVGFRTLFAG